MKAKQKILCVFCGVLTLICNPGYVIASDIVSAIPVYAVWSTPAEKRTATLWYAQRSEGTWKKPIRLDIKQGLHVTPVIAADTEGMIWILWIEQTADANLLKYARVRDGIIVTGRVHSDAGEQSYAPAIVLDSHDHPWIAWSGLTGQYADIFSSHWAENGWAKSIQVNLLNSTPDITPIMGIKNNVIWVSWFGITEARRYVQFLAKWINGEWQVDKKTLPSIDIGNFIQQRMGTETQLPEQAGQRLMGAIFVNSGEEIQSISERFISFQPPGRRK